jgi:hypothetical protein
VLKSHIGKKGSLFVNEYILQSYYLKLQDDRLSHYTIRNLVHFDLMFATSVQINQLNNCNCCSPMCPKLQEFFVVSATKIWHGQVVVVDMIICCNCYAF